MAPRTRDEEVVVSSLRWSDVAAMHLPPRVDDAFVTAGEPEVTDPVSLHYGGGAWVAVDSMSQLLAEGPSREWVTAEITRMLTQRVRERVAAGEVVLSFYDPDGNPVIDTEQLIADYVAKHNRRAHAIHALFAGERWSSAAWRFSWRPGPFAFSANAARRRPFDGGAQWGSGRARMLVELAP